MFHPKNLTSYRTETVVFTRFSSCALFVTNHNQKYDLVPLGNPLDLSSRTKKLITSRVHITTSIPRLGHFRKQSAKNSGKQLDAKIRGDQHFLCTRSLSESQETLFFFLACKSSPHCKLEKWGKRKKSPSPFRIYFPLLPE